MPFRVSGLTVVQPLVSRLKGITCITFDDDSIKASKGLWLYNNNVVISNDGCKSGSCAFFNSTVNSKLELAYFSNALDRFETFSVSFFFKRSPGVSGEQCLIDNSQCVDDGSLFARSVAGGVVGASTNTSGASAVSPMYNASTVFENIIYAISHIHM